MEKKSYTVSYQTKQELAASLKQLMMQKPVEKIKIQELTDMCGMKRQNFYYHFEDIYDLLRWMFQEEAVSLLKHQEGVLLWQEGILRLFQYLEENREVCLCALKSLGRGHIRRFFGADIYAVIHRTIEKFALEIGAQHESGQVDYIDLLTHTYVIMLTGVVESWLLGELDYTPEELLVFADMMLNDQIRGATLRLKEEHSRREH